MGRYLVLWRINYSAMPSDPAGAEEVLLRMTSMVKEMMNKGAIKDWGQFIDGVHGYSIRESEGDDLMKAVRLFAPYIEILEVHEVLPVDKANKVVKEVSKIQMEAMKR